MSYKSLLLLPLVFALAGCLENNTQRAVAGAAGGAVISGATGGSPVTGAVVGGAAGYFCKDSQRSRLPEQLIGSGSGADRPVRVAEDGRGDSPGRRHRFRPASRGRGCPAPMRRSGCRCTDPAARRSLGRHPCRRNATDSPARAAGGQGACGWAARPSANSRRTAPAGRRLRAAPVAGGERQTGRGTRRQAGGFGPAQQAGGHRGSALLGQRQRPVAQPGDEFARAVLPRRHLVGRDRRADHRRLRLVRRMHHLVQQHSLPQRRRGLRRDLVPDREFWPGKYIGTTVAPERRISLAVNGFHSASIAGPNQIVPRTRPPAPTGTARSPRPSADAPSSRCASPASSAKLSASCGNGTGIRNWRSRAPRSAASGTASCNRSRTLPIRCGKHHAVDQAMRMVGHHHQRPGPAGSARSARPGSGCRSPSRPSPDPRTHARPTTPRRSNCADPAQQRQLAGHPFHRPDRIDLPGVGEGAGIGQLALVVGNVIRVAGRASARDCSGPSVTFASAARPAAAGRQQSFAEPVGDQRRQRVGKLLGLGARWSGLSIVLPLAAANIKSPMIESPEASIPSFAPCRARHAPRPPRRTWPRRGHAGPSR